MKSKKREGEGGREEEGRRRKESNKTITIKQ